MNFAALWVELNFAILVLAENRSLFLEIFFYLNVRLAYNVLH